MSSDLYSVLGISRSADSVEIRKAFTKLAKTHHPDKGGNEEDFKKIHKAFEILSNEEKRKIYDMTGQLPGENGPEEMQNPFSGFSFDIGSLFGMFGPHMGGGGGPNRRRQGKPPPKVERIRMTLAQFYNGNNFQISLDRNRVCSQCTGDGAKKKDICAACHGSGYSSQTINVSGMVMHSRGPCTICMGQGSRTLEKCDSCNGVGKVSEKKILEARIVAGSQAGETIVFQEACSEIPEFEKAGDLHIVIEQAEDKHGWKRTGQRGQDLEITTFITLSESLVGVIVKLDGHPAYDDGLFIQIPAGSFTGDVYCISNQGMPIKGQTGMYGDLYVHIQVSVKLTERRILASDTCQEKLKELFEKQCRVPDDYEEGKTEVQKELFLSRI